MLGARHLCWAKSKRACQDRMKFPRGSTWASKTEETEPSMTPRQVQPIILTFKQPYLMVMLILGRAKTMTMCSTQTVKPS